MQNETPETDGAWDESCPLKKLSDAEKKDFAAKLERERNGLQRAYDEAIRQMNEAIARAEWLRTDAIAELEREREELRAAIRNLRDVSGRHHSQIACERLFALLPENVELRDRSGSGTPTHPKPTE